MPQHELPFFMYKNSLKESFLDSFDVISYEFKNTCAEKKKPRRFGVGVSKRYLNPSTKL